jgi:hypothetical protein
MVKPVFTGKVYGCPVRLWVQRWELQEFETQSRELYRLEPQIKVTFPKLRPEMNKHKFTYT